MQKVEGTDHPQPQQPQQVAHTESEHQNAKGQCQGKEVCVWGIEKFYDEKQCLRFYKKNFQTQDNKFVITDVFKPKNKPFFYVRFNSGQEKELFLISAKKQRKIRFKDVQKLEDPNFLSVQQISRPSNKPSNKARQPTPQQRAEVESLDIRDVVEPYHNLPYEAQIKQKVRSLEKVIENYNIQFFRDPEVKAILAIDPDRFPPLKLTEFIQCQTNRTSYRNKTQFTIGYNSSNQIAIGFNKGSFQNSTSMIQDPRNVSIVPKTTKMVGAILQNYIKSSEHDLKPYDRHQHKGFWRHVVIRESQRTNQVLIMVVICNQGVEEPTQAIIEKELVDLFRKTIVDLKGLCVLYYNGSSDSIPIQKPKILWGEGSYHQNILGHNFRVSSSAFLQTNTQMCETLYSKIIQLVQDCDLVLDLCCGIGTIGICIKNKNPSIKVIGIELCAQAVEDAKLNDPSYEVELGRVEDTIKSVVEKNQGLRIVGILDPPRAGMGKDVITALRRCRGLDHIIYVACSPASVQDNILGLTLPTTSKRKAPHFQIKQLYGLDLFPQTSHYEALYNLTRT